MLLDKNVVLHLIIQIKQIKQVIFFYHSFPLNNPSSLKEWLVRIKRENFKPNRSSKICSGHFKTDCFNIEKLSSRKRLTSKAVPTSFSFKELKERLRNS